jgi:hypothetical protein
MLFKNLIKLLNHATLKNKREQFFRKLLENFFVKNPHFKQFQVVDHFVREGIVWQTVYNALK